MSDLAKLKEEATALNIQFPSNITYEKLLQRIEAVKALPNVKEQNNPNDDESDTKDKEPNDGEESNKNLLIVQTQNNQSEEEQEQEETLIKRVSKCGNYRVKIKGLEETARRSGVTIEDLKSVLGTGKLLNNFTFEIA
ncbi:hypothetical protein [Aliarcobacter butzleri]|uniref:hypothetical protein n=1 Tax=Aliarcobacter butzleri TaxID=28197 RepID=UPI0018A0A9A6|nr:hypothetical protein [Aliarcobacter butzleri]MBF7065763.1 hypothetical protein [Aliarcobacter butzleri]